MMRAAHTLAVVMSRATSEDNAMPRRVGVRSLCERSLKVDEMTTGRCCSLLGSAPALYAAAAGKGEGKKERKNWTTGPSGKVRETGGVLLSWRAGEAKGEGFRGSPRWHHDSVERPGEPIMSRQCHQGCAPDVPGAGDNPCKRSKLADPSKGKSNGGSSHIGWKLQKGSNCLRRGRVPLKLPRAHHSHLAG